MHFAPGDFADCGEVDTHGEVVPTPAVAACTLIEGDTLCGEVEASARGSAREVRRRHRENAKRAEEGGRGGGRTVIARGTFHKHLAVGGAAHVYAVNDALRKQTGAPLHEAPRAAGSALAVLMELL